MKACGRYSICCTRRIHCTKRSFRCNGPWELVLVSEDRGLPETGLDDSGAAELGSLENTREQRLGP